MSGPCPPGRSARRYEGRSSFGNAGHAVVLDLHPHPAPLPPGGEILIRPPSARYLMALATTFHHHLEGCAPDPPESLRAGPFLQIQEHHGYARGAEPPGPRRCTHPGWPLERESGQLSSLGQESTRERVSKSLNNVGLRVRIQVGDDPQGSPFPSGWAASGAVHQGSRRRSGCW